MGTEFYDVVRQALKTYRKPHLLIHALVESITNENRVEITKTINYLLAKGVPFTIPNRVGDKPVDIAAKMHEWYLVILLKELEMKQQSNHFTLETIGDLHHQLSDLRIPEMIARYQGYLKDVLVVALAKEGLLDIVYPVLKTVTDPRQLVVALIEYAPRDMEPELLARYEQTIEFLVKRCQLDVNVPNTEMKTAFDCAFSNEQFLLADILYKLGGRFNSIKAEGLEGVAANWYQLLTTDSSKKDKRRSVHYVTTSALLSNVGSKANSTGANDTPLPSRKSVIRTASIYGGSVWDKELNSKELTFLNEQAPEPPAPKPLVSFDGGSTDIKIVERSESDNEADTSQNITPREEVTDEATLPVPLILSLNSDSQQVDEEEVLPEEKEGSGSSDVEPGIPQINEEANQPQAFSIGTQTIHADFANPPKWLRLYTEKLVMTLIMLKHYQSEWSHSYSLVMDKLNATDAIMSANQVTELSDIIDQFHCCQPNLVGPSLVDYLRKNIQVDQGQTREYIIRGALCSLASSLYMDIDHTVRNFHRGQGLTRFRILSEDKHRSVGRHLLADECILPEANKVAESGKPVSRNDLIGLALEAAELYVEKGGAHHKEYNPLTKLAQWALDDPHRFSRYTSMSYSNAVRAEVRDAWQRE